MLFLWASLINFNHFSKWHLVKTKKHGLFLKKKQRPTRSFFCLSLHALLCPWKNSWQPHPSLIMQERPFRGCREGCCCYAQLLCAFFKPIYRPAAEAFLATRLPPLTGQCYSLVFVIKRVLGWKMPTEDAPYNKYIFMKRFIKTVKTVMNSH